MTPEAYDLADALFALAHWNWMNEENLIAIRHPETGRLDHISIMGAAGNPNNPNNKVAWNDRCAP